MLSAIERAKMCKNCPKDAARLYKINPKFRLVIYIFLFILIKYFIIINLIKIRVIKFNKLRVMAIFYKARCYLICEEGSQCSSKLLNQKDSHNQICRVDIPATISQLKPSTRSWFFRTADYLGYVPLIGSVVGGGRMIAALAMGIISGIGVLITSACGCKSMKNHCVFFCKRAKDEMVRGVIELFPGAAFYVYFELHYAVRTDDNIVLKFGANGKFVHQTHGGRLIYTRGSSRCYQKNTMSSSSQPEDIDAPSTTKH